MARDDTTLRPPDRPLAHMRPLARARALARPRCLRWEAIVCLLLARGALKLLPFRWLTPAFERPPRGQEPSGDAREHVLGEVRRAVHGAARQLPGTVCFPKAIAAQSMLRRRGVATTLYWGAAFVADEGLSAHAWLKDGDTAIIGVRASAGFPELLQYGPRSRGPAR